MKDSEVALLQEILLRLSSLESRMTSIENSMDVLDKRKLVITTPTPNALPGYAGCDEKYANTQYGNQKNNRGRKEEVGGEFGPVSSGNTYMLGQSMSGHRHTGSSSKGEQGLQTTQTQAQNTTRGGGVDFGLGVSGGGEFDGEFGGGEGEGEGEVWGERGDVDGGEGREEWVRGREELGFDHR